MGTSRRLVILGKQGAGKGTQAERLAHHYHVPRISTGDIFRTAVKEGTEAGRRAKVFMDAGDLVPDKVVVAVVAERLDEPDAGGFVLDGFPRNLAQAEALDSMLVPDGVDLVIELQVPTVMVLHRLAGRRVCVDCGTNYSTETHDETGGWICERCGGKVILREDDTTTAISRRLALYEKETEPLLGWYMAKDKLAPVDGVGSPDTVTARVLRAIDGRLGLPA
ncbi:MAG TPA: adenylate kinase [Acidimicrobiales bacterium]|nr:adenylate kinase [Acidimicrobiales bacterium]